MTTMNDQSLLLESEWTEPCSSVILAGTLRLLYKRDNDGEDCVALAEALSCCDGANDDHDDVVLDDDDNSFSHTLGISFFSMLVFK